MSKNKDVNNIIFWDPTKDSEADNLTNTAAVRIKRDLINLYTEPPPGIFVVGDETNLKFVYAIIVGPMNTPYEGGLFYFVLKCPNDYPLQPPRVKLMTTDAGRVRFNPNLYANGKICVSTLGTWMGPPWSPAQQLSSLLISIQSLLTERPYFNEPGFDKEATPGDSDRYNDLVTYETLKVAVCGMVENDCKLNVPEQLQVIIKQTFLNYYDQYITTVDEKMHLTGRVLMDCFSSRSVTVDYKMLKARLMSIHHKLTSEPKKKETEE